LKPKIAFSLFSESIKPGGRFGRFATGNGKALPREAKKGRAGIITTLKNLKLFLRFPDLGFGPERKKTFLI